MRTTINGSKIASYCFSNFQIQLRWRLGTRSLRQQNLLVRVGVQPLVGPVHVRSTCLPARDRISTGLRVGRAHLQLRVSAQAGSVQKPEEYSCDFVFALQRWAKKSKHQDYGEGQTNYKPQQRKYNRTNMRLCDHRCTRLKIQGFTVFLLTNFMTPPRVLLFLRCYEIFISNISIPGKIWITLEDDIDISKKLQLLYNNVNKLKIYFENYKKILLSFKIEGHLSKFW